MSEVKITDLVEQSTIDRLQELGHEMRVLLAQYTTTATQLAKGLEIPVKAIGDIERLEALLATQTREAAATTERLNTVIQQQGQVIANTTPTISRQLMEQEKLNKTQREAYNEHDRVKRLLERVHDTYQNQALDLVALNKQLEANKNAQGKLEKAYKQGGMATSDYMQQMAALVTKQRELQLEKRELTQLMTAEEKAGRNAEDSYIAQSQKLELLKKAYKGMGEEAKDTDLGRELESTIQNLDAHLKDLAADMGEFQRNVGNYAIAGQNGIVSTESLNAALNQQANTVKDLTDQNKILAEAKAMLNMSDTDYQDNVDAINAKIEENNKRLEESGQSQQSAKKSLKELVLEIANLTIEYSKLSEEEKNSAEGKELAEHIQELTERAGELKDAINDTNQAIANAASDTRGLDQLSEGLGLAVDGFGFATGAAEIFGLSTAGAAEVQSKLQAAIVASNAISKIQLALQKESAIMQGVANLQTKAGTIAIKLKTAAEGKGVVTTKLLTAAQWLFNKACSANPIGILVLAIMALIAAAMALIKIFNIFGDASEKRKKQYETEKGALEALQKSNERAMDAAKARGASEWETAVLSIKAKEKEMEQATRMFEAAKKAYKKDDDEYKEALESKTKANEEYWDDIRTGYNSVMSYLTKYRNKVREKEIGHVAFLKEKYQEEYENQVELVKKKIDAELMLVAVMAERIKAIFGAESEQYKAMLQRYEDLLSKQSDLIKELGKARDAAIAEAEKEAAKKEEKRQEALLKEQIKARNMQLELIEDKEQRKLALENESYNNERRALEKRIKKLGAKESKMRQALEAQLRMLAFAHERKLEEIRLEGEENRLKITKDNLNAQLALEKEGTDGHLAIRLKLVQNAIDAEVNAIKKKVEKCELTEEEGAEMIALIHKRQAKDEEKVRVEHNEKVIQKAQQHYAKAQAIRDNDYVKAAAALKRQYAQDFAAAKGNADKQERLKEKLDADLAALDAQYALASAKAAIKSLEEALKIEGLTDTERAQLAAELAKAKADYEKEAADAAVESAERAADADAKATAKRIANVQTWLQKAAEALNAINDLASAIYDNKVQRIEDEQEANDEAAKADIERITQLVEQNVITEEEGEARKRAAEAATAKKNEELEKKKQDLKHKQAVWDKANSLAQAGIATALAITQALPNIVLAAIAGAMGAIQIATILATPIPKYVKGTDRHKGGPAIVGDGGQQEVVMYNGAAYLTPDKPTLVDLPAGASVLPSVADIDESLTKVLDLSVMPREGSKQSVVVNNDYTDLQREMSSVNKNIKAFMKQRRRADHNAAFEAYKIKI